MVGGDWRIWHGQQIDDWYCNEAILEPLDDDNEAFTRLGPGPVEGPYRWFELSHVTATVPTCDGSYFYEGIYEEWPYYIEGAPNWWLWRRPSDSKYRITNTFHEADGGGDNWWLADVIDEPNTTYTHQGLATGDPDFNPSAADSCIIEHAYPGL